MSAPKGMIAIPEGNFMMGARKSDTEAHAGYPMHKVILDSFFMDITTVTQKDYSSLMGRNPSFFKHEDRPVEKVTWFDAVLYCNARSKRDELEPVYTYTSIVNSSGLCTVGLENLEIDFSKKGYRLPTEAEWEYACRAGTETAFYWGDEMDDAYGWWHKNAGDKSNPVGKKKPNAWGLYDMSGNVWQWCSDWYGEKYYAESPEKNPRGPETGTFRIHRGGSWLSLDYLLASGLRYWLEPFHRFNGLGFRCVRS
jgi:formylglycine-generating enzyme required for sulfatase activity